jgi:hypothetical protein
MLKKRNFNRLVAVVLFLLLFSNSYAALIVHLPLDANSDSVFQGSLSFVKGVSGDAIAISSPNDAITLKHINFDAHSLQTISVGCWFKADGLPKKDIVAVSVGGWQLAIDRKDGNAYFTIKGLTIITSGIGKADGIAGYSNTCDGKWHHIMGIYDGKALSIYIDGVMEYIGDVIEKNIKNSSAIVIGQTSCSSDKPICLIDDVRIYNEGVDYKTIAELSKAKPVCRQIRCRKVDLHKDFWDKGVIPIQAHRGGGFSVPEHTMETYRQTWAMGMVPEGDMRTTKDGVIICVHDNDTKRVAPAAPAPLNKMNFDEMTLEQVKTLDVGTFRNQPGQKIPTLEEAFAEMQGRPERKMYLDYKDIDFKQLSDLVNKYGLGEQAVFAARQQDLICRWQQASPNSVTMIWMGGSEHSLTKIFEQLRRDDFAGISILQIIVNKDKKTLDGISPSIAFLKERQAELAKKGIALQILPWKISDKEIFVKLLASGFRFFATDYSQEILESYKEVVKSELPDNLKK